MLALVCALLVPFALIAIIAVSPSYPAHTIRALALRLACFWAAIAAAAALYR